MGIFLNVYFIFLRYLACQQRSINGEPIPTGSAMNARAVQFRFKFSIANSAKVLRVLINA